MYKEIWKKITGRKVEDTKPRIPFKTELDREFWRVNDDPRAYQYEEKYNLTFGPLFSLLQENDIKIGPVVFDIGAGTRPLSKHLFGKGKEKRKIFAVDFLKPIDNRFKHVDVDVNTINKPKTFEYRRRLIEICNSLDIEPRTASREQVDVMIFSEILNYVPYKQVLTACIQFLKKGGVIVIYNQPGRTFDFAKDKLPTEGVQSNADLQSFLANPALGLECLVLQFSQEKSKYNGEPVMLVVMRKK